MNQFLNQNLHLYRLQILFQQHLYEKTLGAGAELPAAGKELLKYLPKREEVKKDAPQPEKAEVKEDKPAPKPAQNGKPKPNKPKPKANDGKKTQ